MSSSEQDQQGPTSFDLQALNLTEHGEQARTLAVMHPLTGQPIGITMELLSAESATGQELQRRMQRGRIKAPPSKRLDPTEIEQQGIRFLAALVKGWSGVEWKGEVLACTFDNAVMLFTQLPWLRKQVDDFVYDAEAFLSGN